MCWIFIGWLVVFFIIIGLGCLIWISCNLIELLLLIGIIIFKMVGDLYKSVDCNFLLSFKIWYWLIFLIVVLWFFFWVNKFVCFWFLNVVWCVFIWVVGVMFVVLFCVNKVVWRVIKYSYSSCLIFMMRNLFLGFN